MQPCRPGPNPRDPIVRSTRRGGTRVRGAIPRPLQAAASAWTGGTEPAGSPEPAPARRRAHGRPAGPAAAPDLRCRDRRPGRGAQRCSRPRSPRAGSTTTSSTQRMRAALTARTAADLEKLTADLPATAASPAAPRPPARAARARPVRDRLQELDPARRAGGGCPSGFTSVVYKGSGRLDLRAAELSGPDTTMLAVAYKSRIDVLVPPGVRVELDGFGVSKGWSEHEEPGGLLPARRPGGARARRRLQGHHRGQHPPAGPGRARPR